MRTRPCRQQRGQPGVAVAGVVGDDGQVAWRPARSARRSAATGMPGHPEPADQHGRAVRDPVDRLGGGVADRSVVMPRSPARRPAPGRRRCRSRRRPTARPTPPAAPARVPRIRPPEAPSGWPIAIAPPLALTISGSTCPGVDAGQRLHREGLVELDRADVGPADAGPGQRLVGRLDGRVAEELRLERRHPAAGDPRDRGAADGAAAASDPSSTADAPSLSGEALPGGDGAVRAERRLQAGQLVRGRAGRMPSSRVRSTPGTGTTRSS